MTGQSLTMDSLMLESSPIVVQGLRLSAPITTSNETRSACEEPGSEKVCSVMTFAETPCGITLV